MCITPVMMNAPSLCDDVDSINFVDLTLGGFDSEKRLPRVSLNKDVSPDAPVLIPSRKEDRLSRIS